MSAHHPPYRPPLLSHQPARLFSGLRELGIVPRLLALQPPLSRPEGGCWGLLPQTSSPLIIDLAGRTIVETAMLLADLQHAQRRRGALPIFLMPQASCAAGRLLRCSQVTGIALSAEAAPEQIARWLGLPLRLGAGVLWVGLAPAASPSPSPHLVPLLVALAHASSVAQAAGWCALSGRRAYDILAGAARRLALPPLPWRCPRRWAAALCAGLARPPATDHEQEERPMTQSHLEQIAAALCGCTIERCQQRGPTLTLTLDEPRQGRLLLTCEEAALLDVPEDWTTFAERPEWRRKASWVDIAADDALAIYLADDTTLLLRLRRARIEREIG